MSHARAAADEADPNDRTSTFDGEVELRFDDPMPRTAKGVLRESVSAPPLGSSEAPVALDAIIEILLQPAQESK